MSDVTLNLTTYNNLTNVTDPYDLLLFVNNATGGLYFLLFTLSLGIIVFIALMKQDNPVAAGVASSFVVGLTGILLVLSGAIDSSWIAWYLLPAALMGASAFIASRR